jgi:murein DD-endopeptidase MepM/ murein hydrolase activator NlpD
MSETQLNPRVAHRLDDAQPVLGDKIAVEPAQKNTGRRELFSRRASPSPVLGASSAPENPVEIQSNTDRKSFGSNIPIERWFARFAVRVGGQIAWLTTCEQGRSLLFRYTSHFVILAVLIGAVGLVSTAKTTSASNLPVPRTLTNGVSFSSSAISTTGAISTTDDVIYNQFGQGGPIVVDQVNVSPQANPFTAVPTQGRRGVISYTVQAGDTLFGIAAQFGLRPESVLWANYDTLEDNPHLLRPGMELALPPVNGIVYTVKDGDTVEGIAEVYKVTPDAIYTEGFEWNKLKAGEQPEAGAVLIIPGGSRDFKAWALTAELNAPTPDTSSNSSGVPLARTSNAGFCTNVGAGLVGSGNFIWPAPKHWLSGTPYTAWHPAIDIAAKLGDPIVAADSGVVAYAGWSSVGYGNLVVIDHGNGWQTWYAHNSEIYVSCGQNVNQGDVISAAGSTGRSTGPHLHFETRFQGTMPNPFNVLPAP